MSEIPLVLETPASMGVTWSCRGWKYYLGFTESHAPHPTYW